MMESVSSLPAQRDRPARPPRRNHPGRLPKVVLTGIGDLDNNLIISQLRREYRILESGMLNIHEERSSGKLLLSHQSAAELLSETVNEHLFGEERTFGVVKYTKQVIRLFMSWIPKHLTNADLLKYIPGAISIE